MKDTDQQLRILRQENEELRMQLQEAQETLQAIRSGEVDALVVDGPHGEQIFSLKSADYGYRVLIEEMQEGAVTLAEDGIILYANQFMEKMLGTKLERIIGTAMEPFVYPPDRPTFQALLKRAGHNHASAELRLVTGKGEPIPSYLSANSLSIDNVTTFCLVLTDLRDQKRQERILVEERLSRSIIDQSADALIVCDDRGSVIRASRVAFDLVGGNCLARQFDDVFELHVRPAGDGPSEPDSEFELFTIDHLLAGKRFHSCEAFIAKDGVCTNHLLLSAAPLLDDSARVVGGIVNLADISEKVKIEKRLRESQEWLSTTLMSIGDGVIATDDKGRVVLMNPVAERLTGWTEAQAVGKPIKKVFPIINEDTRLEVKNPIARVLREKVVVGLANHTLLITKDGRTIPIADSGAPIRDDQGKIIGVVLVFRDQTAEREAQKALRESERKLSTLIANLPGMVYRCINDRKWTMLYLSDGCQAVTGYDPSELIENRALAFNDLIVPDDRQQVWDEIQTAIFENRPFTLEYRILDKTNSERWVWEKGRCVAEAEGHELVLEGFISDITELKRSEDLLREREEVYRAIVEQAAEGIVLIDPDTFRFIEFNDAACDGLGCSREEFADLTLIDLQGVLTREEAAERVRTIMQAGHAHFENQQRRKDGTLRDVLTSDRVINVRGREYIVGIWQDITEQKRSQAAQAQAEAQLRQAQKMEALGTLAGGIAHDFNNILGIIIGFTELALSDSDGENPAISDLHEVLKAANRAKDLVQQILAFSRRWEQEKRPVQVGLIVKEAMKMLRASLPATIQIKTKVVSDSAVMADPTQLHQVLMNLCSNSAHAMQGDVGILQVALTDVHLGPESIPPHSDLQPGPHVKLTVQDSGHGIDPAILERIFDPFFTTKGPGAGTGLGLSVVHGLVKNHRGAILVKSVPGEGTTIEVFFPVIQASAEDPMVLTAPLPRGNERVLVVDDEPALARAVKQMLEQLGYQVEFRTNGIDALAAVRQADEKPFDLVITDMTMPHLTGADLARELLKLQPHIAILLCTGFSEHIDAETAERLGIQGFLMKPVVFPELAAMVRKVLDETPRWAENE